MSLPSSEQWRPIPGWEGAYEVSDLGRVRSLTRKVVGRDGVARLRHGRLLRPWPSSIGYPCVYLGRQTPQAVHRLVMLAFVGPRPDGHEVRHLDGDHLNPSLANLVYGTKSENNLDRVRHGTHYQANQTHCLRGHPYDERNTYVAPRTGHRSCRACGNARSRAAKERRMMRAAGLVLGP